MRIRGLRWWMISLIMLGSVVNYLTRSTLAVAAPTVLRDLHISEREYSWILGAFQGAIMAQPVCGYVLDVLGLKAGFAIFAIALIHVLPSPHSHADYLIVGTLATLAALITIFAGLVLGRRKK